MSAPRKIWTPEDVGECGPYYPSAVEAEGDYGGTAQVYHHDEVVRELVEALKGLLHHEIAHVGPHAGARVIAARAALAKIAQEGC